MIAKEILGPAVRSALKAVADRTDYCHEYSSGRVLKIDGEIDYDELTDEILLYLS